MRLTLPGEGLMAHAEVAAFPKACTPGAPGPSDTLNPQARGHPSAMVRVAAHAVAGAASEAALRALPRGHLDSAWAAAAAAMARDPAPAVRAAAAKAAGCWAATPLVLELPGARLAW